MSKPGFLIRALFVDFLPRRTLSGEFTDTFLAFLFLGVLLGEDKVESTFLTGELGGVTEALALPSSTGPESFDRELVCF